MGFQSGFGGTSPWVDTGGGGGGGAVTAVATGDDDRLATFSAATTLAGETNLTFDGNTLTVNSGLVRKITTVSGTAHTVAAGEYFISMTSTDVRTVTLISAAAGIEIVISDSGGNATTNAVIINANSGDNIQGASSLEISTDYGVVTLIAIDTATWMVK